MQLLQEAIKYLERGWSVIPLLPRGKKSPIKWEKYQHKRATIEELKSWWHDYPNANIGIVTGAISGFVALDIDGDEGRQTMSTIGSVPETPINSTGKGYHYLFKHPGREVRNFARRLPGLDFRGDGGYIVAPPSVHPSGQAYDWSISPEFSEIAPIPNWLNEILQKSASTNEPKIDPVSILAGVSEGERNQTLFKYACRLRAKNMRREETEILLLEAARNCSPPLADKEVQTILESAWRYPEGETREVESLPEAKGTLHNLAERIDDVYKSETIGALALMRKEDPAEYAKIKQALKGKVNLNDLERTVKKREIELSKLRLVDNKEKPFEVGLEEVLPKIPVNGLKKPAAWNVTRDGVWQESKFGPVQACYLPVVLTKRLENIDTGEEKVELSFYRDHRWRRIVADRATIFNKSNLISLTNKSLMVSSENAKHLVRYLTDFEQVNMDTLPIVKSVGHMGWVGDDYDTFLPGAAGNVVLDVDGSESTIANGYKEKGTLEEWKAAIEPLRKFPLARFMISASFATPLLKIVGQRVFLIHNWGPSRGGKTAALKAALSVWGEPEEVMASFNATKVGLERLASFYCDLPLGIDERQVVGDKQGFVESLVYLLGLGKGKARGAKNGGLQAFNSWRTIALTTGEEPLSNSSSTAGIKTRTSELYGKPIPDEKQAAATHAGLNMVSGVAGKVFIERIIKSLQNDSVTFQADFKIMQDKLTELNPDNISSHLSAISLVCLADYYASTWIFGLSEEQAAQEVMELAKTIIEQLETANEADDATRAYDYLMSWFSVHESYFEDGARERYGFIKEGKLCIYPTVFEAMMKKEGGFNSSRILRDWADKGLIDTVTKESDGKRRFKKQMWDSRGRKHVSVVAVFLNPEFFKDPPRIETEESVVTN